MTPKKNLNADNLLLPDPTSQLTIAVDEGGMHRTVAAVDWAETILLDRLEEAVPSQLLEQYETCRRSWRTPTSGIRCTHSGRARPFWLPKPR